MVTEAGHSRRIDKVASQVKRAVDAIQPFVGYQDKSPEEVESTQHFGSQLPYMDEVADHLVDHGISPHLVSFLGAWSRQRGSHILGRFPQERKAREERTGKEPRALPLALSGVLYWSAGLAADALDGVMAKKLEEKGSDHNQKLGRELDGLLDHLALNRLALDILSDPENPNEHSGWAAVPFLNALDTGLRSSAVGAGIEMGKAATGSQMGLEAVTLGSHVFEARQNERARGHLGAILTWVRARDVALRYQRVLQSGDKEAIKSVTADIIQIVGLQIASSKISKNPYFPFVINGVKLADIMWGEVNEGKRISDIVTRRGIEIFNEGRRRLARA